MFGTCKHLIACLVLIVFSQGGYTQDFDPSSYCVLVPENFNLADVDECSVYYTCVDGVAVQKTCSSGEYYDKDTQKCTTSSSVCSKNSNPCEGTVGAVFLPDPSNCYGYIYCKDGQFVGTGVCPNGMTFVDGECTYKSCPNTGNTQLSSLCQIFPVNKYFGSFTDCTEYQKCVTGSQQPTTGNCDTGYVYDAKIQLCNKESDGMCDGRGDGSSSTAPAENCKTVDDTLYDENICSVYYVCEAADTPWQKKNCPAGEYYDLVTKACASRQSALPYYKCDRCEGSSASFVNAVSSNCTVYSYCVDGKQKSTGTCDTDTFFNEQLGGCAPVGTDSLTKYQTENGACKACGACVKVDTACVEEYERPECDCTGQCP